MAMDITFFCIIREIYMEHFHYSASFYIVMNVLCVSQIFDVIKSFGIKPCLLLHNIRCVYLIVWSEVLRVYIIINEIYIASKYYNWYQLYQWTEFWIIRIKKINYVFISLFVFGCSTSNQHDRFECQPSPYLSIGNIYIWTACFSNRRHCFSKETTSKQL